MTSKQIIIFHDFILSGANVIGVANHSVKGGEKPKKFYVIIIAVLSFFS